jgi:site-specific recombinase XerC
VAQGTFAPDTAVTLHGYYAEWIETKTRTNTREGYAYSWKHISKHYGPRVKLSAISRRSVKQFYTNMVADGVGYGAIEKAGRVLSSMLSAAVDDELLRANPALGVKVPKKLFQNEFRRRQHMIEQARCSIARCWSGSRS